MFTRRFIRIFGVFVGAIALLVALAAFTAPPSQAALAKAGGLRDRQPMSMGRTMPMTTTMPMGKAGMGHMLTIMGQMMQMMGEMDNMRTSGMGAMGGAMSMTSTMPMTSAMPMTGTMPMMHMMNQMMPMMMQHMQSMMGPCTNAKSMTGAMPMTGATPMGNGAMDQMMPPMMQMMSNMQKMMGAGMKTMSHTLPMTQTMPMAGSMHMGQSMQMMGLMMQMMGQMQNMTDMDMSTVPTTSTMPMTDTMPMHTEMCQMMGMMNQMMTQMMDSRMQPFDLLFIDSMIMHHQGAINMAKAAQTKAEHAELKTLAKDIIAAQEAEIKQMEDWRKTWYPNTPETKGLDMDMGTMQISADTSKSFDLRFIQAMIPHHQGAIEMAKMAQAKAAHPEIKTLAGNIIQAQQKEIEQMKTWQTAW